MGSGTTELPRLTLAALASGATAGLLMALAILAAAQGIGGGSLRESATAGSLAVGLAAGIEAGLIVASLPAFLAGAAMCALGRRFEAARRVRAWVAAGAGAGALAWAAFAAAVRVAVGEPGLARPADSVLAMLVGIAAALAFRAVARPGRSPGP